MLAFSGSPKNAVWLNDTRAQALLSSEPRRNVEPTIRTSFLTTVNEGMDILLPHVRDVMKERAAAFLDAHRRVRDAARIKGLRYDVQPMGHPDILGVYVYLPVM